MITAFLVFLGAGIGGLCRYEVAAFAGNVTYAFGTFLVNSIGCLLAGLLLFVFQKCLYSQYAHLFFMTGLLGGFTTFSTFSAEVLTLFIKGEYGAACGYAAASFFVCLIMVCVGYYGAKLLLA